MEEFKKAMTKVLREVKDIIKYGDHSIDYLDEDGNIIMEVEMLDDNYMTLFIIETSEKFKIKIKDRLVVNNVFKGENDEKEME